MQACQVRSHCVERVELDALCVSKFCGGRNTRLRGVCLITRTERPCLQQFANQHAVAMDLLLTTVLQADLAHVQVRQNEDVRRISAWVALAAGPTMVAGIYGMNFETMPELTWKYGYPTVLLIIATLSGLLFAKFKISKWL